MNPQYAHNIGATTLPPTLRAAVERVLNGQEPEGLRLRNQPRSRTIALVNGQPGLATFTPQEPFLWWGLSGAFDPKNPNDLANVVSFTIEVTDGCFYFGDSTEGAALKMITDVMQPLSLMPPVLVVTKQPIIVRTKLSANLADDATATFNLHGITIPVVGF